MSGNPFSFPDVGSRESIRKEGVILHSTISEYMESMPPDQFIAPQGEHWSPDGHLRHITKATRAVAKAMSVNKGLLMLRFGISFRPSDTYDGIREKYLMRIAAGAGAGRFTPSDRNTDVSLEDWKAQTMDRWKAAGADLIVQLDRWHDTALDRLRLPHPLLGKLTVREILFFTLLHNAHHAQRTWERSGKDV
ncbi:MAG: DinB family protein [Gemmatimonadota bacterium]|nr:DinB family protein [Gemmatimonadota bacterium]